MNQVLTGGFDDPAVQSAHAFRALLDAMARPGRIHQVAGAAPPAPVSVAAGVALLTLCDATTPLHLAGPFDTEALRAWVRFHCGAPLVAAKSADFALGTWEALQPIGRFKIGEPAYPDRSVTLIVEMPALTNNGTRLSGPGIETSCQLSLPDVSAFQANRQLFPLGFDTILTCGDRLAALPRSTFLEGN